MNNLCQRRLNGLFADSASQALHHIRSVARNVRAFARRIAHSDQAYASPGIRKGGQLVRDGIPMQLLDGLSEPGSSMSENRLFSPGRTLSMNSFGLSNIVNPGVSMAGGSFAICLVGRCSELSWTSRSRCFVSERSPLIRPATGSLQELYRNHATREYGY